VKKLLLNWRHGRKLGAGPWAWMIKSWSMSIAPNIACASMPRTPSGPCARPSPWRSSMVLSAAHRPTRIWSAFGPALHAVVAHKESDRTCLHYQNRRRTHLRARPGR